MPDNDELKTTASEEAHAGPFSLGQQNAGQRFLNLLGMDCSADFSTMFTPRSFEKTL